MPRVGSASSHSRFVQSANRITTSATLTAEPSQSHAGETDVQAFFPLRPQRSAVLTFPLHAGPSFPWFASVRIQLCPALQLRLLRVAVPVAVIFRVFPSLSR